MREAIRVRRSVFTRPLDLSQPSTITATALFGEALSAPKDAAGAQHRRVHAAASRSVFCHLLREDACREESLVDIKDAPRSPSASAFNSGRVSAGLARCSTMRDIVEEDRPENGAAAMQRTYSAVLGGNRLWGGVSLSSIYDRLSRAAVVKDRTWLGRTYRACAESQEMISCLVAQPFCGGDSPRSKRAFAVEICRELQRQHAIVHVWEEEKVCVGSRQKRGRGVRSSISTFRDRVMFFRFCLDTTPAAIESDGTSSDGGGAYDDEAELATATVAAEETGFLAALDLSLVDDGTSLYGYSSGTRLAS